MPDVYGCTSPDTVTRTVPSVDTGPGRPMVMDTGSGVAQIARYTVSPRTDEHGIIPVSPSE